MTLPHHCSARARSISLRVTRGGEVCVLRNENIACPPDAKWVGCFPHSVHSSEVAQAEAARRTPPRSSARVIPVRIEVSSPEGEPLTNPSLCYARARHASTPFRARLNVMRARCDSLLVETDWLAARLDDPRLRVVDIRGIIKPPDQPKPWYLAQREAYLETHIPGAVFIDWVDDIVEPVAPAGRLHAARPARLAGRNRRGQGRHGQRDSGARGLPAPEGVRRRDRAGRAQGADSQRRERPGHPLLQRRRQDVEESAGDQEDVRGRR